jgi:hypothetical protein
MNTEQKGTRFKLHKKALKTSLIIGAIVCLPLTGFIYGFIICSDCESGLTGLLGRTFLGMLYAFFTIFSLGKPWTGGGIITSVNLRLYVLLVFLVISLITYFIIRSRKKGA